MDDLRDIIKAVLAGVIILIIERVANILSGKDK